tara:strand:+ start:687 stop:806 length:120 start_codon:yes stop_codon:yes gene_type:complete
VDEELEELEVIYLEQLTLAGVVEVMGRTVLQEVQQEVQE